MILSKALDRTRKRLSLLDPEIAEYETLEIIEFLSGLTRSQIILNLTADRIEEELLESILRRREAGEPLPYILERAFFYHRYFVVSPAVLIPRSETETLIETVLSEESTVPHRFIDLGTGSGIIAATLTEHRKNWRGVGVDLSIDALRIARRNCQESVNLVCSDLFESLCTKEQYDFIVSNPPYISESELARLDPSVRKYEPLTALRGGESGTDFYRRIAQEAGRFLVSAGKVYCEIGYDQGDSVPAIFAAQGWSEVRVFPDLAGRSRVVSARAPQR